MGLGLELISIISVYSTHYWTNHQQKDERKDGRLVGRAPHGGLGGTAREDESANSAGSGATSDTAATRPFPHRRKRRP